MNDGPGVYDREAQDCAVRINVAAVPSINLADFQNSVPAITELAVVNEGAVEAVGLELTLESEPAFLKPRQWRLDSVAPHQTIYITDLDVRLDGTLLSRLTESEKSTVRFVLRRQGDGAEILSSREIVVELLPRNQWGGIGRMPEMVSAFVQPNDPAVERVLKAAADVLRRAGRSSAIDGYTKGPKRAWEIVSAIWSAVVGMRIDYSLPPASFEQHGQKIRGPSQISDSGLATCLDLTLLFAAAIEQAHLNPVLVFTKGHAFVGAWLKAEEFSTSVVDDVTALRKRVKLKELLLFESTLATHRPAGTFTQACERGARQISEEEQGKFELAVDVQRSRMARIKPLAMAEAIEPMAAPPAAEPELPEFDEAPDLPEDDTSEVPTSQLDPKDRLARWQRKLLDLSLRNSLLNFRSGKKALTLEAPDPGALEDLLAEGQTLKLLPAPDLMQGGDPRSQELHEARTREDVRRQHALDAMRRKEVFIRLAEDEMEARLVELYRSARNALQEGGANTLYLALGFLVWCRDDRPGQRLRAPLILLPVSLHRKSVRSGFTLSTHEDEPRLNPTLIEMLRQDFTLDLGIASGELPRDDAGLDVTGIWRRVRSAIKDIKGWEVSEDVVLSMFSFAKFLMWKDLVERTDQLRENSAVKHLIDTPREAYASHIDFPQAHRLDVDYTPQQIFCPLPADSSQLCAIMAAAKGKDFVLIGPPGTGKSQTIANLIAQNLAEGKRVLFVAEKIAALDVVYRRLREVSLGEFCLELHSNKARKLDVLAQLQKAWESVGSVDEDTWKAEALRLKKLRDELSIYVERLHIRHPNGWTIFEAIGGVVSGEEYPQLRLSWPSANAHGSLEIAALRELVARLEVNSSAVGIKELTDGPLTCVGTSEWSPSWQQGVVEASEALSRAAIAVRNSYARLARVAGMPPSALERHTRSALCVLARALTSAAGERWQFLAGKDASEISTRLKAAVELLKTHQALNAQLSPPWPLEHLNSLETAVSLLKERDMAFAELGAPWPSDVAEELDRGLGLLEAIALEEQDLSVKYSPTIGTLNVMQLQRDWVNAENSFWPVSWLRKRKVQAALDSAIASAGVANVAADLAALVRIRLLREQVEAIDASRMPSEVWVGLKTRVEFARSAQKANAALIAARTNRPWEDVGLDAAAQGRCGERWALEVQRLRRLKALDGQIASLSSLRERSDGLWAGHSTKRELLAAAIAFQRERWRCESSGELEGDHRLVAGRQCGPRLEAEFRQLTERWEVEQRLRAYGPLAGQTDGLWSGLTTSIDAVERALKFHASTATAMKVIVQHGVSGDALRVALWDLLGKKNPSLAPGGAVHRACAEFVESCRALQPALDRLARHCAFDAPALADWGDVPIAALIERTEALTENAANLRAWCAWRKVRGEAVAAGLAALVGAIESSAIVGKSIRPAFEVNYCRWWLGAVVENEPVIRTFVSAEHERRIGDFRALDDKFANITRQWIRARLCAELPGFHSVDRNTEWGLLRREINKKRRHLPLRELLSRIPSVVLRLTPCLLMSPLSIAQYLPADASNFDVVIFDEASQIPVWDAIGAMARGKQVVMVGDPKQLPPTSFFDRAEAGLDDEDVEGDLESILDECLGASLPTRNLTWHYRSRHESLIAFSNHRYYGGGLVTFPSPITNDRAVSFHHVNGVYEKGGARINKPEARALVADLVATLKSPGFAEAGLSIGVVTFNSEQQALIEDLLDEERRLDPALEPFFSESELEPVFVKNLETVQGDERDIMYFSITYGPDQTGAISMNFGPLNRDGGERRLNVAITRARHELRVFSSLKGEQMDLSRTRAAGVRDLKHFLEFAELGPRALAQAHFGSRGDFESPFEQAVAEALGRKGWQVHTQVGASAFRVDLGVVHPGFAGKYLAGIECDGATYHRSATARDRDKLREQVLRGLGWQILRIWSTDWWVDPKGTLEKVDGQLRTLLDADRSQAAAEVAPEQAADASLAAAQARAEYARNKDADGQRRPYRDTASSRGKIVPLEGSTSAKMFARDSTASSDRPNDGKIESAAIDPFRTVAEHAVDPQRFFEQGYDEVLQTMIAHVLGVEGPMLDVVLARRIARAHGFQRTGRRIQERVEKLAAKAFRTTREDEGTVYWPEPTSPAKYTSIQLP